MPTICAGPNVSPSRSHTWRPRSWTCWAGRCASSATGSCPGTVRCALAPPAMRRSARTCPITPFHHPTMVLRRSTALAVGGYRDLPLLEDYWLWERMMLGGAQMANLSEVLVDYRVDEDQHLGEVGHQRPAQHH